jgi:hypothetical protein
MEHVPAEQVFTVRAFAGELPVECFLSARVFQADLSQLHPAFSEDHVHACYELLLCRKGSGYQFIGGTAHAYTDESVFVLAPFVTHAHIGNPGSPELRCSSLYLPEGAALSVPANLRLPPRWSGCGAIPTRSPCKAQINAAESLTEGGLLAGNPPRCSFWRLLRRASSWGSELTGLSGSRACFRAKLLSVRDSARRPS